jgi:hypothetical protein
MALRPDMGDEKAAPSRRWFKAYIRMGGLVFSGAGLAMLLATSGTDLQLVQPDPVFGLTNRILLRLAGVLHLVLGGALLAPIDIMQQNLLTLWAGWCHLVYFVGMIWLKAATPFPTIQLIGWTVGANDPKPVDVGWRIFIVYLLIGSLCFLVLERRRLKRLELEMLLNRWKKHRERGSATDISGRRGRR